MNHRRYTPRGRIRVVLEELLWEAVVERESERLGELTSAEMSRLRRRCRMSDEMIDEDVGAEDDEPSDPPRWTLIDDLNGRLEGSWVRRIARMRASTIKKLAKAATLTEEQVEGILWSAKSRVNPLHGVHARPPRGLTAIR